MKSFCMYLTYYKTRTDYVISESKEIFFLKIFHFNGLFLGYMKKKIPQQNEFAILF